MGRKNHPNNSKKKKKKKKKQEEEEKQQEEEQKEEEEEKQEEEQEELRITTKKRRPSPSLLTTRTELMNFVEDAGPGCHICRMDDDDDDDDDEFDVVEFDVDENQHHNEWQMESNDEKINKNMMYCKVLGWERDISPEDFEDGNTEDIPDIAIDPDERTLTVCNVEKKLTTKVAYVTVYEIQCYGKNGLYFRQGSTTDDTGRTERCTTFIILCPPMTFCHVCVLRDPRSSKSKKKSKKKSKAKRGVESDEEEDVGFDMSSIRIDSDVQDWSRHPDPSDRHALRLTFPLLNGPFLCTQGEGGRLTHFFSGNLHAVDFRCPIGTPLLAAHDGIVVDVNVRHRHADTGTTTTTNNNNNNTTTNNKNKNNNNNNNTSTTTLTGIAVSNLFSWNSIMLKLDVETPTERNDNDEHHSSREDNNNDKNNNNNNNDTKHVDSDDDDDPLFVEYVHIESSSVQVGDRVARGQIIGTSGSVGFSPEPHLHFAAYRSDKPDAPTVGIRFRSAHCHHHHHCRRHRTIRTNDHTAHPTPFTTGGNIKDDDGSDYETATFLPKAGTWYDENGPVDPSTALMMRRRRQEEQKHQQKPPPPPPEAETAAAAAAVATPTAAAIVDDPMQT